MPTIPPGFIKSIKKCGLESSWLADKSIASILVEKNQILSINKVFGVDIKTKTKANKTEYSLHIKKSLKTPIFLCFGVLKPKGEQVLSLKIVLEENVEAKVFSHCAFPTAKDVSHKMDAVIELKKQAKLIYEEKHYHGEFSGAKVVTDYKALLDKGSFLYIDFVLNQGTMGLFDIKLEAELKQKAICNVTSKMTQKNKKDLLKIYDKIILKGAESRGLIKIRAAAVNGGKVIGNSEIIALGAGSKGHIDCQEIIVGKDSIARAVPILDARHPEARITHEASIGKINQKELETLMTRGLSEKEAIDFLIQSKIK